jgi:hypothetical protein
MQSRVIAGLGLAVDLEVPSMDECRVSLSGSLCAMAQFSRLAWATNHLDCIGVNIQHTSAPRGPEQIPHLWSLEVDILS